MNVLHAKKSINLVRETNLPNTGGLVASVVIVNFLPLSNSSSLTWPLYGRKHYNHDTNNWKRTCIIDTRCVLMQKQIRTFHGKLALNSLQKLQGVRIPFEIEFLSGFLFLNCFSDVHSCDFLELIKSFQMHAMRLCAISDTPLPSKVVYILYCKCLYGISHLASFKSL